MEDDAYAAVFRSSPDAILLVDAQGRIREANPMAETLFGYARGELVGAPIERLVPERDRGAHVRHRQAFAGAPSSRPMGAGLELTARRRDGDELPVEIALAPTRSREGEPLTIAAVRDVSQRRRLRTFGAAALHAAEQERLSIARELHDDTAQRLSALLLRLRLLERDAPEVAGLVHEFREGLAASLEDVRRVARSLRPPELADAGLAAALRAHARAVRDATGFEVALDLAAVDALLDDDERLVLYRVFQEAVTNADRHSGTRRAAAGVGRRNGHVVLTIADQGAGFDPVAAKDPEGAIGLVGMHERAVAVGGRLRIDTAPGRGTTVTLTLPVRERHGDPARPPR